jgi:hypothetical protein
MKSTIHIFYFSQVVKLFLTIPSVCISVEDQNAGALVTGRQDWANFCPCVYMGVRMCTYIVFLKIAKVPISNFWATCFLG